MAFVIKDTDALDIYNEIWDKIKNALNIKFRSMPVYEEKYSKSKEREFNGVIRTTFLGDEIPKEDVHHTCIACITIDFAMNMEKKISASLFRRLQIQIKENKDDQIHKHCIKVRVRVRVRVKIWQWIRVKAKIWFSVVVLLLFIAYVLNTDGWFLDGFLANLSHFADLGQALKN